MKITNFKKSKVTPKLSDLLLALTTAFLLVACGGGGSAVGSDSTNSTNSGSVAGSGTGTGTSTVKDDDDDDCKTTTTTVAAKSKNEIEDDDVNELDDDDDDEKCPTAPPVPPTEAELAAGKLGKALWATNCFSCHGADTHEVRTAARILKAINENKGGMGKLKGVISETDAANIAVYAAKPSAF